QALGAEVARLEPGQGLAIVGPRRSGRSTLANRLSWSLGVSGTPVARVEPSRDPTLASRELVELELASWGAEDLVVVVDDLAGLDDEARAPIRAAAERGARIVAVGDDALVAELAPRGVRTFVVPPLD